MLASKMVETIAESEVNCVVAKDDSSLSAQNIPVIFIENGDGGEEAEADEINDRIINALDHYAPSVRVVHVAKPSDASGFGFLLSRSKWDPYPYISRIDEDSPASSSGLKEGDCVLEVNGEDVLGMRIADVANLVKSKNDHVDLLLWNTNLDQRCESNLCCGPMPLNYEKLAATVQTILTAIECPVCFNTIPSPFTQCQNGHLLCLKCRARSDRCPICRDRYSVVRCLLAEQIYTTLLETFDLQDGPHGKIREKIFGAKTCKSQTTAPQQQPKVHSHTQKFLAKIMGKATSMESLSQRKEANAMIRNKVLSQSANNICRPESSKMAVVRCPSMASQHLGSELSNSCGSLLGTRRPRSCNGSAESLPNSSFAHNNCGQQDATLFHCPAGEECLQSKLRASDLVQHVSAIHRSPAIFFGTSSAEISLPPRSPVENASLLLQLDGKQFWTRVVVADATNNDLFVSCLMQAPFDYTTKYVLEIAIRKVANKILGVQLINRNEIYSLESTSWQEIFAAQCGIKLSGENILATFAGDEINLQVSIKRIEDI